MIVGVWNVFAILSFHLGLQAIEPDIAFNIDPDTIFKSILGRKPNYIHETTHPVSDIPDEKLLRSTKVNPFFYNTNKKPFSQTIPKRKNINPKAKKINIKKPFGLDESERVKILPNIEARARQLEIERIFANELNPIPNFDKNEDDPALITRRFDTLRAQIHIDGRRHDKETWKRNLLRNRSLNTMEHFIYETRYKLPYAQLMRAKYYNSERYRIGFCYGLLYQLKRQQMLMYTEMKLMASYSSTLHLHLRLYEKVVRLDVDIKDTIRFIRTLESKRRLKDDPKYYDEFEEDIVSVQDRVLQSPNTNTTTTQP